MCECESWHTDNVHETNAPHITLDEGMLRSISLLNNEMGYLFLLSLPLSPFLHVVRKSWMSKKIKLHQQNVMSLDQQMTLQVPKWQEVHLVSCPFSPYCVSWRWFHWRYLAPASTHIHKNTFVLPTLVSVEKYFISVILPQNKKPALKLSRKHNTKRWFSNWRT